MLNEFKKFAVKGSVFDMAIGIIIGGVFTPIVKSLVNDIVMPPIGLIWNADFTNMFKVLSEGAVAGPYDTLAAAQEVGAVTMNYGLFINSIITFILVAFAVFMLVRVINKWKDREEEAPAAAPKPSDEVVLLTEIRDALSNRGS